MKSGQGGCDPSHQCALDFRYYYARKKMKPIRDRCCCPTFLIALAGPWMCILGAVFVDHVVVEQLTDFVWIGGNPYNDKKLKLVTHILASLRTGIAELGNFYEELGLSLYGSPEDPQRFFPFIRHYSVGEHVVRFSYQDYLTPKTLEAPKAIFLATTETESPQKIVVKFVQTYNTEAHRLLASANRAPQLLYCSADDPNPPELGGLIMVVMEYSDGITVHQRYGNDQLPQLIFEQVEEGLEILHANNIVFGDLRPPNILITKDNHVLLIDFDWCGLDAEQTYPVSLNDAHDINQIHWHPGVKRGGIMKKEHDIFMLQRMKPS
ncbi:kinase-like domain-containing protein [Lactarius vividus]|nr:kinase-like domain-containing protein [Lactarius vividus]